MDFNEIIDHMVAEKMDYVEYKDIAEEMPDGEIKDMVLKMADDEHKHYKWIREFLESKLGE